jgi:uncharacterized membrane protein
VDLAAVDLAAAMGKGRLEAFSDGVFAIILTIMVLEIKAPHGADLAALGPVWPTVLSYALSFVYVGIYWNNHHHMLHATRQINGWVMWANLHLFFWLSLIPVATGWLGEHASEPLPAAAYGVLLIMAAVAYTILLRTILAANGPHSEIARAIGRDRKGTASLAIYALGIGAAFVRPWIAEALYVMVAVVWFIPDRRIEGRLHGEHAEK